MDMCGSRGEAGHGLPGRDSGLVFDFRDWQLKVDEPVIFSFEGVWQHKDRSAGVQHLNMVSFGFKKCWKSSSPSNCLHPATAPGC